MSTTQPIRKTRLMHDRWETFRKTVLRDWEDDESLENMRHTFYSGAAALMSGITDIALHTSNDAEKWELVNTVIDEVQAYFPPELGPVQ